MYHEISIFLTNLSVEKYALIVMLILCVAVVFIVTNNKKI